LESRKRKAGLSNIRILIFDLSYQHTSHISVSIIGQESKR
jgi:hypothetical protein